MKSAGKSIYLPKKERQLAEKLAVKKYYMLRKQDLMREFEACNAYIRKVQKENNASDMLLENDGYIELLGKAFGPHSENLEAWMTYETSACPIGMERIEQVAEYYFG